MSSAIAGTALPAVAHAEVTTLHVNNGVTQCSDSGTGTEAQPYCTVQAAADDAQPGQTVQIAMWGHYREQVTVRNSGTAGKPITFKGVLYNGEPSVSLGVSGSDPKVQNSPYGFLLAGVHDIAVSGFNFGTEQEGVLVRDSDRIVLDRNAFHTVGVPTVLNGVPTFANPAPAVRLTSGSANTTVSRNRIYDSGAAGIVVEAGATGAIVTTNQLTDNRAGGIAVTDAPGTVLTSNTITQNCAIGVTLAGASAGSTVSNNIVAANHRTDCAVSGVGAELLVSAGSTTATKVDYNVVHPRASATAYSWGGSPYASAAEFRATGNGVHDATTDPKLVRGSDWFPTPAENVTDAADATAPGQLDTDINGNPRVDHPGIANTGAGNGHHDRGAFEIQDPVGVSLWATDSPLPGRPLRATMDLGVVTGWSPAGTTLDFGDGSAPSAVTQAGTFRLEHDYPAAGTYTVTLSAISGGLTRTATSKLTVRPVSDIWLEVYVPQSDRLVPRVSVRPQVSSPWPLASYSLTFGDGTPAVTGTGQPPADLTHDYPSGGAYTVTLTVTDDHGREQRKAVQANVGGPLRGVPVSGYWGGPASHLGLFDQGRWVMNYQKTSAGVYKSWYFGDAGDTPVVGSWDNGASGQYGVYRPSTGTFALQMASGSVLAVPFGAPGDIPVPGNWDGNGHHQLAIYRASERTLAIRHDNEKVTTFVFGDPGDIAVVGDWDGVRHAQIGVFRPGRNPGDPNTFVLRHDDGTVSAAYYGVKGDLPVVGDWQGRGRTTFGIFRPSTNTFALSNAYAGQGDSVFQILA